MIPACHTALAAALATLLVAAAAPAQDAEPARRMELPAYGNVPGFRP